MFYTMLHLHNVLIIFAFSRVVCVLFSHVISPIKITIKYAVQELALFYQQQDDECTPGFSSSMSSAISLQKKRVLNSFLNSCNSIIY